MAVLNNPQSVRESGWGSSFGAAVSQTGSNAVFTVTGVPAPQTVGIYGVAWSYSGGTPAATRLTITDGSIVVIDLDLDVVVGEKFLIFPTPFLATPGNNIVITLYSGGGSIVGKVAPIGPFLSANYPAALQTSLDFSNPVNSGLQPVVL